MIVTVASYKGGVGKTTTAVHLAAYFAQKAPTVLIDGDPNRNALSWGSRGTFPFTTITETQTAKHAGRFRHILVDTRGRPDYEHLKELAEGCDLLVIPCTPDQLAIEALQLTIGNLRKLPNSAQYRVLLTMVPPRPSSRGSQAREALEELGIPLFRGEVRRTMAFQDAAMAGTTVDSVRTDLASLAWRDYEEVGEEIEETYARTAAAKS